MATLNPTPAVAPSIPLTAFEQQVLKLARKALKTPLSYDEQGFLEKLVENTMRQKQLDLVQHHFRPTVARPGQG